jgi:hypothetical protein
MKRCDTCKQIVHVGCNYNQGRCPHQPPMVDTNKVIEWIKNVFNNKK